MLLRVCHCRSVTSYLTLQENEITTLDPQSCPLNSFPQRTMCLILRLYCMSLCFQGERATGYGVALLTTLYGQRSHNSLLQAMAPRLEKSPSVDVQ